MSRELLIDGVGRELRIAVVEDGTPCDLVIENAARSSLVGNIYLGRVYRVVPSLGAAFVDIGLERAGFLPLGRNAKEEEPAPAVPAEGEAVCVQLVRDAYRNKGAQLSRRLTLAGRYLVYAPESGRIAVSRQIEDEAERLRLLGIAERLAADGEGYVLRTAADGVDEAAIAAEVPLLRAAWKTVTEGLKAASPPTLVHREPGPVERAIRDFARPDIAAIRIEHGAALGAARSFCQRFAPELEGRLAPHRGPLPLFESLGIEDAIAVALERRVGLPSGGSVVFDQTEALCAVDVDSGRYTGGADPVAAALRTNVEAAAEIARQVRLRNIGGLIVIDFIHADTRDGWDEVLAALAAGFADDRNAARILGRTAGGLVEMTRRRRREALHETVFADCAGCGGTGRARRPAAIAAAIVRALARDAAMLPDGMLTIEASPPVIDVLRGWEEDGEAGLGRRVGRAVSLCPRADLAPEAYDIRAGRTP